MKLPEVKVSTVLTDQLTEHTVKYVPITGDHYIHAFVGKQGELRINSVRIGEDADIEKNKKELITTEIIVLSTNVWRLFSNGAI